MKPTGSFGLGNLSRTDSLSTHPGLWDALDGKHARYSQATALV
jgi:hypothetical protein